MFGVVIWSDLDEGKAVIWCEDHGDLAFYRQESANQFIDMDPGDLVQFDLKLDRSQRIVCNPRLVAEGVYDGLTGQLTSARPDDVSPSLRQSAAHQRHAKSDQDSKIVVLDPFRARKSSRSRPDDIAPTRRMK